MTEYILTCNCYEPMFREKFKVKANDLDEAWEKAKAKAYRKYKAKKNDVYITAVEQIKQKEIKK